MRPTLLKRVETTKNEVFLADPECDPDVDTLRLWYNLYYIARRELKPSLSLYRALPDEYILKLAALKEYSTGVEGLMAAVVKSAGFAKWQMISGICGNPSDNLVPYWDGFNVEVGQGDYSVSFRYPVIITYFGIDNGVDISSGLFRNGDFIEEVPLENRPRETIEPDAIRPDKVYVREKTINIEGPILDIEEQFTDPDLRVRLTLCSNGQYRAYLLDKPVNGSASTNRTPTVMHPNGILEAYKYDTFNNETAVMILASFLEPLFYPSPFNECL